MALKQINIINELFLLWEEAGWNYILLGNNRSTTILIKERVNDFCVAHQNDLHRIIIENSPRFEETYEHERFIQNILYGNDTHILQACRHPTTLQDILSRQGLFYGIYCEEMVYFPAELFVQFSDIDHPLVAFSRNPNFDWEILADWSWNFYDFKMLSFNPTNKDRHYRKSQLIRELEPLGIQLDLNSFDGFRNDLISSSTSTTSSSTSKQFRFSL